MSSVKILSGENEECGFLSIIGYVRNLFYCLRKSRFLSSFCQVKEIFKKSPFLVPDDSVSIMDGSYEGGQGVDVWWGRRPGLINIRLKALERQG